MRSVHTRHPCNFQDMWKWTSARPTTSQKLVTPLKTFPTPFYTILLLHQQVLVLWCLSTNCILSWPQAINLRLRRVGVTDSWDLKMAVVLYRGNSASYLDVSLSLSMKMCAQRKAGRRQRARCTLPMVPCGSSPVTRVSRSPLSFVIHIVIIPRTIYTLLFLLFVLLSSGYPDVEPPVRRLRLERWQV